jgi:hypothetical protein
MSVSQNMARSTSNVTRFQLWNPQLAIEEQNRLTLDRRLDLEAAPTMSKGRGAIRRSEMNKIMRTALTVIALLGAIMSQAQTPAYHVNVLGISDGRTGIQVENPTGLNRWGQVVGTYGGREEHAVLWTPNSANDGFGSGTVLSLELSPGFPTGSADTWATGVNDRGQVVGSAYTPGQGDGNQQQSWLWNPVPLNSKTGSKLNSRKGKAVTFPLLNIPSLGTAAENNQIINGKGVIGARGINGRALLWNPTTPNAATGTWTYDPDHGGGPNAINDAGQIAGGTCDNAVWNGPYLHSGPLPLAISDVLTSPLWDPPNPNECIGWAGAINAAGDIAVNAVSSQQRLIETYLYKNGVATNLAPGFAGQVVGINSYDQIVGEFVTDTNRAVLFENGQAFDLNTLNDGTNGLFLRHVVAINDRGQMLVKGFYSGTAATVLLTPASTWIGAVTFTKGKLVRNGTTATQTITVTNAGATVIPGTVSIALDGLTPAATLTNAAGVTQFASPIGSPYVDVSATDLAAGATTASFTLTFSSPGGAIKYTPRVLASKAPR